MLKDPVFHRLSVEVKQAKFDFFTCSEGEVREP